jgi:hypothetical protein
MDSFNRIFTSIQESSHKTKKKKSKKNRYDSSSFGMQAESRLSAKQKKIAKIAGNPNKIDATDLAMLRKKGKRVNASTEIVGILSLLKEAYQDELISEEAFLAIADPIMRSLLEGRSVTFPDTGEMEELDDAEEEEKQKEVIKQKNKKATRKG